LRGSGGARAIWAARCHIKYALSYTKGYRTAVVGDPPPAFPQRCVSQPPLETYITAVGMLLCGMEDRSVRLFDVVRSVPALLMLFLLRRLYGSTLAVLFALVLVMLPLLGHFGFDSLLLLMSLWALYRYLALTGRQVAPDRRDATWSNWPSHCS
jgi:4-amino-4-deoxy-L-arabinose transferase-like glycosyltransferase